MATQRPLSESTANLMGWGTDGSSLLFNTRPMSSSSAAAAINLPISGIGRPASTSLIEDKQSNLQARPTPFNDRWLPDYAGKQHNLIAADMTKAMQDDVFVEELNAIDQWFVALSPAEKTAALYNLLQYCTPVQMQFFIVVLQQMLQQRIPSAMVSPVSPEKDAMQMQMLSTMSALQQQQHVNLETMPQQFYQTRVMQSDKNLGSEGGWARDGGGVARAGDLLSASVGSSGIFDQKSQHLKQHGAGTRASDPSYMRRVDDTRYSSSMATHQQHRASAGVIGDRVGGGRPRSADLSSLVGTGLLHNVRMEQPTGGGAGGGGGRGGWNALSPTNFSFQQQDRDPARDQVIERPQSAADIDRLTGQFDGWGLNNVDSFKSATTNLSSDGKLAPPKNIILSTAEQEDQPQGASGMGGGAGMKIGSWTTRASSGAYPNRHLQPPKRSNFGTYLTTVPDDGHDEYLSDHSDVSSVSGRRPASTSGNSVSGGNGVRTGAAGKDKKPGPGEGIDMNLLEDVAAWLRSLRLHKYTPLFEGMSWREMLQMNDEDLAGRGVAALGARRKMLKVFEMVKTHCVQNNIPM
ncbi:uncharacterized protein VTP21DRAFT_10505 [Calcarisporiella thermophila]|uniref:uncharacterized protein n=1 Tax=Calcarisporiella thermophila TaxID=911321 RepID=UPI003742B8F6